MSTVPRAQSSTRTDLALPRFIAAAALALFIVYGSDVALSTHPELFTGPAAPPPAGEEPERLWAYVPLEGVAFASQSAGADRGEAVYEGHVAPPNLGSNDLARRVQVALKGLHVNATGRGNGSAVAAPLRGIVAWLGGELNWAGHGPASVLRDTDFLTITPDSRKAELNYKPLLLPSSPFVRAGELYMPLSSIAAAYRLALTGDADTGMWELRDGSRSYRVLAEGDVFRIEIDRSDRWLRIYYAGALVKHYSACIGEGNNTPVGQFSIESKAVWPGWRAYWGEYIPGGSSRNPLGARFLRTTARGRATGWGIGIHGTNQPSSIGRRISGGCVRLLNKHAIELYEVIPIGTRVSIHE